jgi:putative membrane protein
MVHFLLVWLISALAFMVTAYLVPGLTLTGFLPAMAAAAVLGFVNALVRPILVLLTLPITVVTLGLFLFVVNALCLMLAGALTPGFEVKSFGWAIVGAVVLSIVSWVLHRAIPVV